MFDFLDVLDQLGIYSLLNVLGCGFPFLFGIFSFLRFFVSGFRSVLQLIFSELDLLLEVRVIDVARNSIKGDFAGGSNDVSRVYSFEGDSVDAVRTSDEEVSGCKALQNDHSSSSMRSREENDNLTGNNAAATCNSLGLISSTLVVSFLIVSGVPGIIFISQFSLGSSASD